MSIEKKYNQTKEDALKFEGMMQDLSIALFQSILSFQDSESIKGDMIEFGVYKGKSASVLLNNLNKGETAYLIDIKDYPEIPKLKKISKQLKFIKGKSEDLVEDKDFINSLPKTVRFSHHDASHFYVNVATEMAFMESRIAPKGLMVLDDFGTPSYMQVIAACFTHLAAGNSPLEVLLYSNNKAYLCRKEDFNYYAKFLMETLLPQVNELGFNCYLTRTEDHKMYRGFSLAKKSRADQPDLYGEHIYGDRFYKLK